MDSLLLPDLKEFMELDTNSIDTDAILNLALDAAQSYVETYCNINISPVTLDIIKSGNNLTTLTLDYLPITSINTLTLSDVVIDVTTLYIDRNIIGFTDNTTVFTTGIRNVLLNITVGYATIDDIPSAIKFSILKIAEKYATDALEDREGIKSYSTSTKMHEQYLPQELPEGVQAILNLNKRYVI